MNEDNTAVNKALGRKVVLVPLVKDQTFRTDGTTNWWLTNVDIGPARNLGPMLEKVRVHWAGEDFTANFEAQVTLSYSTTGRTWSTPVAILGPRTSDSEVVGSYYTTETDFGLNLRLAIQTRNGTGALVESGQITAVLELVLKS